MTQEAMAKELEELAGKFSEGWHEGIKIDASDIMLLSQAAEVLAQSEQEPVAWINAEKRTFEWNGPVLWNTPTVAVLNKIPLYTHPPQRTEPIQSLQCANCQVTIETLNDKEKNT